MQILLSSIEGYSFWLILGIILICIEILVPGVFMLWIGLAAISTGILKYVLPNLGIEILLFIFAILVVVLTWISRKFVSGLLLDSDRPLLNDLKKRMMNLEFFTSVPIERGQALMKISGSYWTVFGPNLPKNTKVRITKIDDGHIIHIEKCEE